MKQGNTEQNRIIVLPSKPEYSHGAFGGMEKVETLIFEGEEPARIWFGAFSCMPDLKEIVFQCPVEIIAFDCSCRNVSLIRVEFQQSVKAIRGSFNDNESLREVVWPVAPEAEEDLSITAKAWRGSARGQRPEIRVVDGFNACDYSAVLEMAPLDKASQISGFRDYETYHEDLSYPLAIGINDQSTSHFAGSLAQIDRALAQSLSLLNRLEKAID